MEIPPFAYGVALLAVVVGIFAGFLVLANNVLRRRSRAFAPSPSQMLADFREAHEAGELTDDEFQNIKQRLAPALESEGAGAAGGATGMADAAASLRGAADTLALGLGVANERADQDSQTGGAEEAGRAGGSDSVESSDHGDGSGEYDSEERPPDSGDSMVGDR